MREPTDGYSRITAQLGGCASIGARAARDAERVQENGTDEVRVVSVLMADLRGFTTFCELSPLNQIPRLLNEYLTAMVDVVLDQHGRIQDFVGDGILAVFGAPGQDDEHAWHAAVSAVEMQLAIGRLGGRWRREVHTAFSLGVAVHTGAVFAGTVGSPRQPKYAVVGDPVNTVARLEELNRTLGTDIVMSGESVALVKDRVDVHPKGSFAVRGRRHTVEVFELIGIQPAREPLLCSPLAAA